ncbi:unnamed protein product [Peniophora sp. CBMAI 1063]|nr:unnamed protein product [Peniophora sp. CBMAI 1063]
MSVIHTANNMLEDSHKRKTYETYRDLRSSKRIRRESEPTTDTDDGKEPSGSLRPNKSSSLDGTQNARGYLKAAYCRESWFCEMSLQTVIVFGDSLSVLPSTWVSHLSRKSRRTTRTRSFAFNGATTADDLSGQLARFFVEFPPKASASGTSLDANDTTYFFFLGSNDCGQLDTDTDDLDSVVEILLDGVHDLYIKAGARNFVFLDVAPMERTPIAIATASELRMAERTNAWNESLYRRVHEFAAETPRASVFLFSANAVLSAVLDDPEEYEFTPDDVETECGPIWADDLHPTAEVHSILADCLVDALLESRSR